MGDHAVEGYVGAYGTLYRPRQLSSADIFGPNCILKTLTSPKVLSELETCTFRNKNPEETLAYMTPILEKHLPLHSNSSRSSQLQDERRRDHYSHFILRLAFSSTEDLRRRFSRLETMLFRLRYRMDDVGERREFVKGLDFAWEVVDEKERDELSEELRAATGVLRKGEEEGWFKVEFEKVPEMVEQRRCLLKRGMAYVPVKEQMSLVVAEFTVRLDKALDVSSVTFLPIYIYPDIPSR